ncbi:sigma-54-dependent Fis family transcriptional regulator [Chitinophaga qingshengii]|uniref:Sigma 54-interacting transcriptional regulator n=1 Tax=Chitinophaga qingshengii TaxID=1569794 RepID=A0ABR7TRQ4_9BACT|nr:sigma 54-interacting transcriptional regulator [Chitinophaga qingshengii]MBC9932263.1 sigma 54-interacting transcriptional regulator [Chitinophaga qingshengii]
MDTDTSEKKELEILLCLSKAIAAARHRADLWEIINEQLLETFGASYYTICLINEDGVTHSPFLYSTEKKIRTITGENPIIHQRHPVHDGIFDRAIEAEEPVLFNMERLVRQKDIPAYIIHWYNAGVKEMMLVRICNGKEPKGVLYLYSRKTGVLSGNRDSFLNGIADHLGTGISNILANEKIVQQLTEIRKYKTRLEQENSYLKEEWKKERHLTGNTVGSATAMKEVYDLVSKVAPSEATVLILGETGTGKELVAHQVHEASRRRDKLMIKVNCAAIPVNLVESELFGHEKGSFTGALERRIGKFELANNSTLFLDEIGELPMEMQAKLLRVLQEKEIERIGGKSVYKVNVRIIAATNKNLEAEVQAGRFRSDLYYRLNVFPVVLPPLRERREDIPALAAFFMEKYATNAGKKITGIAPKVMAKLMAYPWPGNIRELEHLIERTVLLTSTHHITEVSLPVKNKVLSSQMGMETQVRSLADVEREHILHMLKLSKGRISGPHGAAAKLQLPSTTLISKMQKLGIRKEHFVDIQQQGN